MIKTKEFVLNSALVLFSQRGYKDVTLKDIVDATGLSKGAFYHHFNNKEQVFAEVISHFFGNINKLDYSMLSQSSLKSFYTSLLNFYEKAQAALQQILPQNGAESGNFYYLIFDGMRLLPEFKQQHLQQQQDALQAWKTMVNAARNNYEINTNMSNEQVAKLFIYLADGVNINSIIYGSTSKNQLKELWDNLFYALRG